PAESAVEARRHSCLGGRMANANRNEAETSRVVRLIIVGRNRKSIHHRFASRRSNQISPARFSNANSPKNRANDRASWVFQQLHRMVLIRAPGSILQTQENCFPIFSAQRQV